MNVFIVENNEFMVSALTRFFAHQPEFRDLVVIGCAASYTEALDQIAVTLPDVIILDLSISNYPGGTKSPQHGLALLRDLRRLASTPRVLVYSQWNRPYYLWAAWKYGARGFLSKDTSTEEFGVVFKHVITVGYAFTPAQSQLIQQREALPELTQREREVLELLVQGLSYDEVAPTLQISKGTVRTHTRNLFDKFGAHSQGELVALARRLGLLFDDEG